MISNDAVFVISQRVAIVIRFIENNTCQTSFLDPSFAFFRNVNLPLITANALAALVKLTFYPLSVISSG